MRGPIFFWRKNSGETQYGANYDEEPMLEKHDKFEEVGEWGFITKTEQGIWEEQIKGKMLADPMEYIDENGVIKWGANWIRDLDVNK
jgi:hypothetical protein